MNDTNYCTNLQTSLKDKHNEEQIYVGEQHDMTLRLYVFCENTEKWIQLTKSQACSISHSGILQLKADVYLDYMVPIQDVLDHLNHGIWVTFDSIIEYETEASVVEWSIELDSSDPVRKTTTIYFGSDPIVTVSALQIEKNFKIPAPVWLVIDDSGYHQAELSNPNHHVKTIELGDCQNLQSTQWIKWFPSVETLRINDARSLKSLHGLERLKSLSVLQIRGAENIDLSALKGITTLKYLKIEHPFLRYDVENLPKSNDFIFPEAINIDPITDCKNLEELHIKGAPTFCSKETFYEMIHLKKLTLHIVDHFKSLENILILESLKELNLHDIRDFESANPISKLKNLESLTLSGMNSEVASFDFDPIKNCTKLKTLIIVNIGFTDFSPIEAVESIEEISLYSCNLIKSVTLRYPYIKSLSICYCHNLEKIEFESTPSLSNLKVESCSKLQQIDSKFLIDSIRNVELFNSMNINNFNDIQKFRRTQHVLLSDVRITSLNGIEHFTDLETLKISYCHRITNILLLEYTPSLRDLCLEGLDLSINLYHLEKLKYLENLRFISGNNLNDLSQLPGLKNVKFLDLSKCKDLTNLNGIESLVSLRKLALNDCVQLSTLDGIESLHSLEEIHINHCPKIRSLTPLSSLKQLTSVHAVNTRIGSTLSDLRYLPKLEDIIVDERLTVMAYCVVAHSKLLRDTITPHPCVSIMDKVEQNQLIHLEQLCEPNWQLPILGQLITKYSTDHVSSYLWCIENFNGPVDTLCWYEFFKPLFSQSSTQYYHYFFKVLIELTPDYFPADAMEGLLLAINDSDIKDKYSFKHQSGISRSFDKYPNQRTLWDLYNSHSLPSYALDRMNRQREKQAYAKGKQEAISTMTPVIMHELNRDFGNPRNCYSIRDLNAAINKLRSILDKQQLESSDISAVIEHLESQKSHIKPLELMLDICRHRISWFFTRTAGRAPSGCPIRTITLGEIIEGALLMLPNISRKYVTINNPDHWVWASKIREYEGIQEGNFSYLLRNAFYHKIPETEVIISALPEWEDKIYIKWQNFASPEKIPQIFETVDYDLYKGSHIMQNIISEDYNSNLEVKVHHEKGQAQVSTGLRLTRNTTDQDLFYDSTI